MEAAIGSNWQRLGLRQLSGMLVVVYVRAKYLVGAPACLHATTYP
jgi:hypothetical protein